MARFGAVDGKGDAVEGVALCRRSRLAERQDSYRGQQKRAHSGIP
jgi:hypothetical protein